VGSTVSSSRWITRRWCGVTLRAPASRPRRSSRRSPATGSCGNWTPSFPGTGSLGTRGTAPRSTSTPWFASGRVPRTGGPSSPWRNSRCSSICDGRAAAGARPASAARARRGGRRGRGAERRGRGEGGSAMITTTKVYRQELSPVSFLERAGDAHADRVAVQDGERAFTYRAWRARSRRLASALRRVGLEPGDRVAFLALNSEPLLLAHMGVPQAGGILVAVNTRLNADEVRYIMEHSGPRFVFYSPELRAQLAGVPAGLRRVDIREEFEHLLGTGSDEDPGPPLLDEEETIAIDYTSGTTGRPKGVMYTHRGAYLNALAMVMEHKIDSASTYLWTLPMFHCNGWTFAWGLSAVGARSVCIPRIDPPRVWRLLDEGGITHFCAAPTVLSTLASDPAAHRLARPVRVFTAAAPPSPTILARMVALGFEVDHVYGLTESYGPFTINIAPPGVDRLGPEERARLKARQGAAHVTAGAQRAGAP